MSDASELSHVTRQSPTRRALPRSQSQATHGRRPEAQIIALCLTCCCEKRTAVNQFTVLLLLFFCYRAIEAAPCWYSYRLFIISSWNSFVTIPPLLLLTVPPHPSLLIMAGVGQAS